MSELAAPRVLHVEMGRHLYGGARQVAYLLDGLSRLPGSHALVCAEAAEISMALEESGVPLYPLPFGGDGDVRLLFRLMDLMLAHRPDVLHIHSRRGDALAALAGKLAGVPMIYSRRVDNRPGILDLHVKFPWFRKIITISQGIAQVLEQAGVPAQQLVCVPSAVDTERYRPVTAEQRRTLRQALDLQPEDLALGVIAQLIPRKGHEVLLLALPAILSSFPRLRVLFLGRGPLEMHLRELAKTAGLEHIVRFCGFLPQMESVLPALDLIVHPAFLEGLGVSLLEAASCGIPLVASRTGGIPEIVAHGENGFLVTPGIPDELAAAVLRLLDDEQLREDFGQKGRQRVLQQFSVSAMVAGNDRIYRQCME